MVLSFYEWLSRMHEDFASSFPNSKNKWIIIGRDDLGDMELSQQIFKLIDDAYKSIGGHANLKSPDDLRKDLETGELSFIKAMDLDEEPDPDVMLGYKKTSFGNKAVVSSAKKSSDNAKQALIHAKANEFNTGQAYGEVSGPIAKKLLDAGVKSIEDENQVRTMLKGKEIIWHGEHPELATLPPNIASAFQKSKGWYTRTIGGKPFTKIIVGYTPN